MPTLDNYLLFVAASVLLVLTPGPNLLYLISRTLCQGRAAGIAAPVELPPAEEPGELEPARIYGYVTYWRSADKVRKRPMFSIWAGQTLKWIAGRLPPSSAKMIRLGPEAMARAKAGQLRLVYLYRAIAP